MNNHANAQSVANAIELKQLVGESIPENLHPPMLARYPVLKTIVPAKTEHNVLTPVVKK